MNPENEHEELDPLTALLSSVALPLPDDRRREAIFQQTRGVLWRRRLARRSAWVAALAACYIVGGLSVLAWQSAQRNTLDAPQAGTNETKLPDLPAEEKRPPMPEPAPAEPMETVDPIEPGSLALTTFEKLRRAGDRQLNERGNLQGAIGCYRRALDFASDNDLQIASDRDSWLLISLKQARLETRKHDHNES
jgi:hypothetical protein